MRSSRMNAPSSHGWLCVVLHDVTPANWAACTRVLRVLRAIERDAGVTLPLTLLVAPQLDGEHVAQRHYLSGLQRLQLEGHELALQPPHRHASGASPGGWVERLPNGDDGPHDRGRGEAAAHALQPARAHLALGQTWAHRQRLAMRGFVAPFWRLGDDTRQAVLDAGFDYVCTRRHIVALPGGQALSAPSLSFSTHSAWHRGLSMLWTLARAWLYSDAPLLRIDLRPHDADHAALRRCWAGLLATALRERRPLHLAQAAQRARTRAPAPSLAQVKV
jgi:predicted deacetylase